MSSEDESNLFTCPVCGDDIKSNIPLRKNPIREKPISERREKLCYDPESERVMLHD